MRSRSIHWIAPNCLVTHVLQTAEPIMELHGSLIDFGVRSLFLVSLGFGLLDVGFMVEFAFKFFFGLLEEEVDVLDWVAFKDEEVWDVEDFRDGVIILSLVSTGSLSGSFLSIGQVIIVCVPDVV